MGSQAQVRVEAGQIARDDQRATDFAAALTALSAEYGIGIAGAPVLFVMENEDYERAYRVTDTSDLVFE